MQISHRIAPVTIQHADKIAPHCDVIIGMAGNAWQWYAEVEKVAVKFGKPIRGTQLFPRCLEQLPWQRVKNSAVTLSRVNSRAIAWDVIHECHGRHCKKSPWWGSADQFFPWAIEAVQFAREIAPQARLFLSEYRPQERWRMEWALRLMEDLAGAGAPLDGISIQLHSNLLSRQPTELEWLAPVLARSRWEVHCYETMAFDVLTRKVPHRPPTPVAERLQAQRYAWYRDWAERAGATLFGPWHPWDGSPERYWDDLYCHPGIWREDWSPKPAAAIFQKNPPA